MRSRSVIMLADIMMILLLLYVAKARFGEAVVSTSLDLPTLAAQGSGRPEPALLVIEVDEADGLRLNGKIVTAEILGDMLQESRAERLIVRGDRDASWGGLVRALDAGRQAGLSVQVELAPGEASP